MLFPHRYASALSAVLDVERLLACSSQKDLEVAMFCSERGSQRSHRGQPGGSRGVRGVGHSGGRAGQTNEREEVAWGDYWERNEPLRDADEVAVPVLCIRSLDDPLLPPRLRPAEAAVPKQPLFPAGAHGSRRALRLRLAGRGRRRPPLEPRGGAGVLPGRGGIPEGGGEEGQRDEGGGAAEGEEHRDGPQTQDDGPEESETAFGVLLRQL